MLQWAAHPAPTRAKRDRSLEGAHVIARPSADEMSEYFAGYVALVEEDADVLDLLRRQGEQTLTFFDGLSEEQRHHRYAEGKWSLQEVLGHLLDVERVMVTRALAFSRDDSAALPGFDENDYVAAAGYDERSLERMLDEYRALRASTVAFFAAMDEEQLGRSGVANESRCSVRAIPWVLAGHERHHRRIAEERYLRSDHEAC